jgi:dihydrofolate reductase
MGGHGQSTRCPKYVGSNTLSGELEWNATLLEGDLEDSIPKLRDEVDGDLFMHGSGEFAYALAEKGLIDEYEVYLNPLVWGEGNVHDSATGEPSRWSSTT